MAPREVVEGFEVSGQIDAADIAAAAARGVRLIIDNRPDHEEPGQPTAADMEVAATAAGVRWLNLPVRGQPTMAQVDATARALVEADGPVLAYCRSGMRSIFIWALAEQTSGRRNRADLIELARAAGYDLAAYLPG